jgi:hypothetical protein
MLSERSHVLDNCAAEWGIILKLPERREVILRVSWVRRAP